MPDEATRRRVMTPDLDPLRSGIDRVDRAVADLLVKRLHLARRVALWRLARQVDARDRSREDAVRSAYADRLTPHGWPTKALDEWMDVLLEVSLDNQRRLPVAFQGGSGSWSHLSLKQNLKGVQARGHATFDEAWASVVGEQCVAAWFPVENRILGAIDEPAALSDQGDVWLEITHPIRHVVVGRVADGHPKSILGHPKALDQCRAELSARWPEASLVQVDDGGSLLGARPLGEDEALLGTPAHLLRPGLAELVADASDIKPNWTRFRLVVAKTTL